MAAQIDYSYSTPKGVAGGKFDIGYDEIITRKNEEEDGILKYGIAVMTGTMAGTGIKIPASEVTAQQIEGIVLHAANTEQDIKGKVVVRKGASVSVLRKGHVWGRLASDATVTYGATAYVVTDGDDAGTFTDKADGNIDISARFGNAFDDGIAVIELK